MTKGRKGQEVEKDKRSKRTKGRKNKTSKGQKVERDKRPKETNGRMGIFYSKFAFFPKKAVLCRNIGHAIFGNSAIYVNIHAFLI